MRGNYASPSELLLALRETGKSYWDLIGKPLNQNTGYNLNNPHAAEEKQYNEWYDSLKLSDEDNIKLQQLLSEYDKNVKSNTDSLPKYKKGKDKFRSFAAQMGPRIYRELHKQGIYSNNTYDNMMRQLAWESNYANSLNAINNHNYAGIRTSATKYAKYKNDDLFAQEYVSLIKRKYPNAVKAKNPVLYAKALKDNGYYEDSVEHYALSLAAMSSISNAVKAHMAANPSQYEVEVLLEDLKKQSEQPAVSTRVTKPINREPINKEPFVNTPIPTKAPLITRPEYLESNSLIKKSFELNMNNMLLGKEFLFKLPGFKKGKDSKKPLSDEQYIKIMEDVANANYERWGYPNQDAALLYVLNANDYDYRGYYNKYPPNSANSLTHWSDEFKTAYHPSFSDESKYSGHKNKYNPDGIVGGHWYNDMFVPSFDQLRKLNKLPHFRGGKDSGIKEYASNEDMHINQDGSITTRSGNTGSVILPDVNVYAQKDYNSAFDYSGANEVMGTIADFTPVVGDVKQGLEAANDLRKGNYKEAAIGAGLLLLPNVLEKPLKYAGKKAFNFLLDKAPDVVSKYLLSRPQVPKNFLTIKPQVRTRVGDVEVDNPLLTYRQGDASMGADFLNTGVVSMKNGSYENPMFAQGKLFYGSPSKFPTLLDPSLGATKRTRSGRVFLLRKSKDMTAKSDLLVSDIDMANANKNSRIVSPYIRVRDEGGNTIVTKVNEDIRRVPFAEEPATSKNTTLYRWKPNYGYKKIENPESTYVVGKEIVDDAGNLNINVDDLLEQIKTKYPYTLNPEDLINKGINGSTDLSEHIQAVVQSAQTYPLPEGVSRKEFVTAALYHDLGKVFGDFGHGTNSAVIASELNLPITRNAIKAISQHMNQQEYFETASQLEKALHAADVGRGMKYKALVEKYPYLKYDTPKGSARKGNTKK